jgi:hypothetical protein
MAQLGLLESASHLGLVVVGSPIRPGRNEELASVMITNPTEYVTAVRGFLNQR